MKERGGKGRMKGGRGEKRKEEGRRKKKSKGRKRRKRKDEGREITEKTKYTYNKQNINTTIN